MIDTNKIRQTAECKMVGTDLFVVDIKCSPSNEVELLIDSDSSVSIDSCIELSKEIEAQFDREVEDFELTVASAGIGQPLKVFRQYRKLIGKPVEVLLKSGIKIVGEMIEAAPESLTLSYSERVVVEGKKRKELVVTSKCVALDDIKSTKEFIDFK